MDVTLNCQNMNNQFYEVELALGNYGHGFTVKGGQEDCVPLYISDIEKSGPAFGTDIRLNDQIFKINGVSTEDMKREDAMDLIKSAEISQKCSN